MKSFLKYTLATICGLVIFTFIAGLIFFASLLGMAASGSSTTQVKDNSVFVLKMDGAVQERMEGDTPLSMLLNSSDMDVMGLEDIVASIKKAKDHNDIKGIYIEGGLTEFDSPASAQQVRDALKDFKKSGKWILAYADNYTQQGYYVASVADTVILNLTGMIELKGIGGKREYMTGLYEKLGVKYQPVRVGKYKSYVESVTRKDMSPENREQTEAYQQGIWKHMLRFSIPMAIGLLFQQLYNTVDTLVVGQFVGQQAQAAVGSTGPIINTIVGSCAGLATGASVVISQRYGAHDDEALSKAVHTTVAVTFIILPQSRYPFWS